MKMIMVINMLAVSGGAVAAFLAGAVWNSFLFGDSIMKLNDPDREGGESRPPAWKLLVEFARCFVVALALAFFISRLDISGWTDAVELGALLWVGFPAMILLGAVLWENVPWKLAAIHVGDWLVKMLLIAVIIGIWL